MTCFYIGKHINSANPLFVALLMHRKNNEFRFCLQASFKEVCSKYFLLLSVSRTVFDKTFICNGVQSAVINGGFLTNYF